MKQMSEYIAVRCPQCAVVIAGVTAETMVYCITCRKWCREIEALRQPATAPVPVRKPRRRVRCH
ncbi:MAG TPA: hypothetical protein VFZ34_29425 [Blastocatellia bacterium]|nr:hypothetical protein [Blastocatellia bacterium]